MTIQEERYLLEGRLASIFDAVKMEANDLADKVFLIYSIIERRTYFELINEAIVRKDALENDYGLILNVKLTRIDDTDSREMEIMIFNGDGALVEEVTCMIDLNREAEIDRFVREVHLKSVRFIEILKLRIL